MRILRRLILVLVVPLFFLSLMALAISYGLNRTAGNKQFVKQTVASSGIYSSVTNQLLDQGKSAVGPYGTTVSLSDAQVRQVANQVFSAQLVQKNTETVIDSIYVWLEGGSQEPDFKIDLTAQKMELADKISALGLQKAASLPACPSGYIATSFDVFAATCLPAGVTPQAIATSIKNDIAGGSGFLDNPVITTKTLKSDSHQDPFTSPKAKNMPKAYQAMKKSLLWLSIVTILLAACGLLLSASRKVGLRTIGIIVLVAGVFILIWASGSKAIANSQINKIKLDNKVLQANVRTLGSKINSAVYKNSLVIGGIYAALGITAITGSMLIKDKTVHLEPESPAEPTLPKTPPPAGRPPQKPKKYKKISL